MYEKKEVLNKKPLSSEARFSLIEGTFGERSGGARGGLNKWG